MTDTTNDIFFPEDIETERKINAQKFFPKAKLGVLSHNNSRVFHDMKSGKGKVLNISKKHILTVRKPVRNGKNTEDLFDSKKYAGGVLAIFSKERIVRTNPVSILEPLQKIPFNVCDIRSGVIIPSGRLYPDIYRFPTPLNRRIRRTLYRKRRQIAIGGVVFASFSISVILLSLAAKNFVEKETIRTYNRISAMKDIRDFETLRTEARDIRDSFETVAFVFRPFRMALDNRFYTHPQVRLAGNVIHGGLTLFDSVNLSLLIAEELREEIRKDPACSELFFGSGAVSENLCDIAITDFLGKHRNDFEKINADIGKSLASYAGIESLGNPVFDEKLEQNIQSLLGIKEILSFSLIHFDAVMRMLGDQKPERYMVLNQNQDELRANGGFPGSILSFELYKGRLQKFEKHDVYDYDWKLYPYKETPPSGLEGYSGNFGIRDANYYPDFRDSMKKIGFFVEKAGFDSVDTMIAINQGIIIDLLKKYGPVKMDAYNLTIDDTNFSRVVSTLVEARVFPYKKLDTGHTYQSPKEFLFRFMEAFGRELAEKRDIFGYLNIFLDHFQRHEILIASKDSETQAFLEKLGTREAWQEDQGNFLYPIFTSLSANKSDRYMERTLTVKTESLSWCTVHNTVRLDSDHAITVDEKLKTEKLLHDFGIDDPKEQEKLSFIEWNGINRQYIRFLVPKDSILDPGTDLKTEAGTGNYTIFSTFHRTEPMKSSVLEFGYTTKVPNCVPTMESYVQPGMRGMKVMVK